MLVSAPSGPLAVSSIKAPLTFVLVLVVATVAVWILVRVVDTWQRQRRRPTRPWPAPDAGDKAFPVPVTANGDDHDEVAVTSR